MAYIISPQVVPGPVIPPMPMPEPSGTMPAPKVPPTLKNVGGMILLPEKQAVVKAAMTEAGKMKKEIPAPRGLAPIVLLTIGGAILYYATRRR